MLGVRRSTSGSRDTSGTEQVWPFLLLLKCPVLLAWRYYCTICRSKLGSEHARTVSESHRRTYSLSLKKSFSFLHTIQSKPITG